MHQMSYMIYYLVNHCATSTSLIALCVNMGFSYPQDQRSLMKPIKRRGYNCKRFLDRPSHRTEIKPTKNLILKPNNRIQSGKNQG